MQRIARASKTVRNKNILIILMCAAFAGWFAYDGYVGWPNNNQIIINRLLETSIPAGQVESELGDAIKKWPQYRAADDATRARMDDSMDKLKTTNHVEGWKTRNDIAVQRWIVLALSLATAASVWWFIRCQRRRAVADEKTVSPAPGMAVAWDKIKTVDNTRWNSHGIVEIVFPDAQGHDRRAKFDDYELEREPLLAILDELATRAVNAEFIPKEEEPPAAAPDSPEKQPSAS